MIKKISDKEVSVLINGVVDKKTYKLVQSIKKHLPNAVVILSTWENSDIEKIKTMCDEIILNKDPGGFVIKNTLYGFNYNRILVAIQNGLKKVNTKYCLRLRNDLYLKNDKILRDASTIFNKYDSEYRFFQQRVIVSSFFSQKYNRWPQPEVIPMPFHVSDWMMFGLTRDIKKYWNSIDLIENQEDFAYYFKDKNVDPKTKKCPFKMAPEQYYGSQTFSRQFPKAYMETKMDFNEEKADLWNNIFLNNFIPYTNYYSGIKTLKKRYFFTNRFAFFERSCWKLSFYFIKYNEKFNHYNKIPKRLAYANSIWNKKVDSFYIDFFEPNRKSRIWIMICFLPIYFLLLMKILFNYLISFFPEDYNDHFFN